MRTKIFENQNEFAKHSKILRRAASALLAFILALTGFFTTLPGASRLTSEGEAHGALLFTDVQGKWFEMYVVKAINYGIISGYDDSNLFRPNNPVTRAEFCTMVNNAFGSTVEAEINFGDVEKGSWYYKPIAIGVNSGYILGYDDGNFRPNNNISRQEAAVIGERLLPYDTNASNIQKYPDYTQVADWAYAAVQRIIKRGYMGTYDDGKIHPTDPLTRAQAVKIICDIVDNEKLTKTVTHVNKDSKTLSNQVFVGDVVVEKDVAGDSVTFKNCTFLGKLYIYGGGEKSIHLENCRVSDMEVARTDQTVRVVAEGYTTVGKVTAKNSVILEEDNLARVMQNPGFNLIYAAEGSTLKLAKGTYTKLRATEGPANITIGYDASLNALTVAAPAAGTSVTVEEDAVLTNAYAYGACHFLGDERVIRLYCFAEGVTYEKKPYYIETSSSVTTGAISATGELIPVLSPADGATGVSLNPTITISFSKPIRTGSGAKVTSDYIKEVVFFTAKKEGGTATEFKASINDAATMITITPTAELKKKSKFFVYFDEDVFRSQDKNSNKNYDYNNKFSSSFTVSDGSSEGVTFKPANGARGQATSVKPSITFAYAISPAAAGVTELDSSYLRSKISFRKVDYKALDEEQKKRSESNASAIAYAQGKDAKIDYESNGTKVVFSAEVAKKNKGITITPKESLEDGATYYLAFQDGAFKNAETGEILGSQYILFTVGYVIPTVTYTPKDGASYVKTDEDIEIKFDQVMYTKDNKEIDVNYVKNNVIFNDNTSGSKVAFTAEIDEGAAGTILTLNPVSLLGDGHEYTVNVPENIFVNKDKKSPVNTSTSFTTGYTTPALNSLSATGTTSVVTASVTANMVANGYIKVLPASAAAPTTTDQVKSGGTAFTTLEGSPTAISIKGTYTGGEQYKVYAYIYSGSTTTDIKSAAVTVAKDVAGASSFSLQGVDNVTASGESASAGTGVGANVGSAVGVSVASGTTAYTATVPFGSKGVALTINPSVAADTVSFDINGGSSFVAASKAGPVIVNVPISNLSADKTVSVKVTGANKDATTYTLSIRVAGNPALASANFGGTLGKLGTDTYIVPADATSVTVSFTATDANATIQCSGISGGSATGTLSGEVALSAGTTTVTVTVTSNQDKETYTYKFTKLDQ